MRVADPADLKKSPVTLCVQCEVPGLKADIVLDGEKVNSLATELESASLFEDHTTILVRRCEKLSSAVVDQILTYIKNPNPSKSLYLYGSVRANSKLYKAVPMVCDPNALKPWEQERQLQKWLISQGCQSNVAQALLQRIGPDRSLLEAELAKLRASSDAITLELVRQLTPPRAHHSIWEVGRALMAGDSKRALSLYNQDPIAPLQLVGALRAQFTNALLDLEKGKQTKSTPARLKALLVDLFQTEVKLKTLNGPDTLIMETFLAC